MSTCIHFCTDERTEEEKKAEETALFTKYYTEWRGGGNRENYRNIPRFYYRAIEHSDRNILAN